MFLACILKYNFHKNKYFASMFTFKQFSLSDTNSTLKIGTDAVLLGAWARVGNVEQVLDVGCGCGVIALMLAQRSNASILGIDIDENSVLEAKQNAAFSPWSQRIRFQCVSLQDFQKTSPEKFDCIVCNPPYFEQSLKSPFAHKNLSKHTDTLSYKELLQGVSQLLSSEGVFYVILPSQNYDKWLQICHQEKLYVSRCCFVKSISHKKHNRVMCAVVKFKTNTKFETLCIREDKDTYSSDYIQLTKEFYLKF